MTESAATQANAPITLFTIGFAGKSAEEFFAALAKAGVVRLIDVRLNNVSQLAGFTKRRDLEYFLNVIAGIDYEHHTELAPTSDILDAYKKKTLAWEEYERRFVALLDERAVAEHVEPRHFDHACLLCSEPEPSQCHRRLVAEHLQRHWPEVVIEHL
jgi:uncharacterized protein (DUF488 family)